MLESIKLYQANKESLLRSACLLLSKCFKEGLRTLVITKNEQTAVALDNMLWTFSQQGFTPHALSTDNLIEMQPIVIACDHFQDPSFDTLVLLERFDVAIQGCKKVVLMFTEQDRSLAIQLQGSASCVSSNYYIQNSTGEWIQEKL